MRTSHTAHFVRDTEGMRATWSALPRFVTHMIASSPLLLQMRRPVGCARLAFRARRPVERWMPTRDRCLQIAPQCVNCLVEQCSNITCQPPAFWWTRARTRASTFCFASVTLPKTLALCCTSFADSWSSVGPRVTAAERRLQACAHERSRQGNAQLRRPAGSVGECGDRSN